MSIQEKLSVLEEEIKELSDEEKKLRLNEFISQLPEEELNMLKEKQCPFCLMASNKINTKKIYEDSKVLGVLDINPANAGHILLFPKKHYQYLSNMPDEEASHMFLIAKKLGDKIINSFKAKGFNIFLASGFAAGQKADHIIVHIIPRQENDNINFNWEAKKLSEEEFNDVQRLLMMENIEIPKDPVREKPKEGIKEILKKYNLDKRIP
ncbi:MAG: HIT family protein [Nanoarchaeota archaeon]|nr:HIT family protein [Nanoarchaeota archaeon]MBU0962562.1 HIT family protein [Nanoarchaeota archaeon]